MLACLAAIACGGRYGEDPELETARDEPDATTTLDGGAPLDVTARPLSAGMTEWIRTIDLVSAAEGDEVAIGSVAVATDGEIAIAGTFRGSIELGGHPLKSTGPSGANGNVDTFVAKLTASGELRWIKSVAGRPRFRSVRIKAGPAVAFGASGEIVLSTEASGAVAVDGLSSRPGARTAPISPSSGCDRILAKRTIDLGSEKKTSSGTGARVSAFVTSIVR